MRYVSIDIETTGLSPQKHSILEFAAVIEDTQTYATVEDLPYINFACNKKHMTWDQDTLKFHLKNDYFDHHENLKQVTIDYLPERFKGFLRDNGFAPFSKIIVAGKNLARFDLQFLEKIKTWNRMSNIAHRVLDPIMLYMRPDDEEPPNMATCMTRAELELESAHYALGDARDVIRLIRHGMGLEL